MTPYLLILAVLLGIAPGLIAHGKGRNFLLWWIYGVFLGPIALLHAILLRPKLNPYYETDRYAAVSREPPRDRRQPARSRAYWPMALLGAASVAVAIVAVAAYGILSHRDLFLPILERDVAVSADRTPNGTLPGVTRGLDPAPATGSQITEKPAAEQPRQRDETPTVRVTVRSDTISPAPPEQLVRAPALPVERVEPQEKTAGTPGAQTLERTEPRQAVQETPSPPAPTPAETVKSERDQPGSSPPEVVATLPAMTETHEKPAPAKPAGAEPSAAAAVPTKAPPAKPAKPAEPQTSVTAVGETVQIVQLTLAKKGYDPGPANGRAGIKTQTAIRKFQADRGLQPTGAIDYDLLEKLGIVGPRVHAFRPPPGATPGR